MGSGSVERCLRGEEGGCEAAGPGPGPGPGTQLAGRGRQPPSISPPSARPRPNIFCLWNKTSKWCARLDHPGRRAEERSFLNDEPRPQQASAQPGRLSGPVGLGKLPRPRPCPSHRADSPPPAPGGGRREAQRAAPGTQPEAWGRPQPEAGFPDPSAPRVPLRASKFPPVFASGEQPPCPRLGLDAGGWGAGEQDGWRTARLPSFPRAQFRAFPAPRGGGGG